MNGRGNRREGRGESWDVQNTCFFKFGAGMKERNLGEGSCSMQDISDTTKSPNGKIYY